MELIIRGRGENTEGAVNEIMKQVEGDYKPSVVKPKHGKNITKVMLDFHDKDFRNMCWWEMIDRDDGYKATAEYNGEDRKVKMLRPKFEIARDDWLFRRGKLAALKQGLKFKECRVNRDLRVVLDPNGNVIASQSKETWEAKQGPPDM